MPQNLSEIQASQLKERITVLIRNTTVLKKETEEKHSQELQEIFAYFNDPILIKGAASYGGVHKLKKRYIAQLYNLHLILNIQESVDKASLVRQQIPPERQRKMIARLKVSSSKFAILTPAEQQALVAEPLEPLPLENQKNTIENLTLSARKFATLFPTKQKKTVSGFATLIQSYKAQRAYSDLTEGEKFKKAGFKNSRSRKDGREYNVIEQFSKSNINHLIQRLQKTERMGTDPSVLLEDEKEIFKLLQKLPYKLQHATNAYYPIANAGSLDSSTEIQKQHPFVSPFGTGGNIKKLGNGGFVFFRVYVDGTNGDVSRYGNTTITSDISLLEILGWISLHDQLKPFSRRKSTTCFRWDNRLFRTAETVNIHNETKDKNLRDGIQYNYRSVVMTPNAKKETQKAFRQNNPKPRVQSFTREIFYGKDIIPGIALSIIYQLRLLKKCGFRKYFLDLIKNANDSEKILLLGKLIKGLFRIEGKYPVSIKFDSNPDDVLKVKPLKMTASGKKNVVMRVKNPDGDHRYNRDLSVNEKAMKLALLKERQRKLEVDLSNARRLCGKYKDNPTYKNQLAAVTAKIKDTTNQLAKSEGGALFLNLKTKLGISEEAIDLVPFEICSFIWEHCRGFFDDSDDDETKTELFETLAKNSIEKLRMLLQDPFEDLLSQESMTLEDFEQCSIEELQIMQGDPYEELLSNGTITFEDLSQYTAETLKEMSNYALENALNGDDKHSFEDLVNLYIENPTYVKCACSVEIGDLITELAPKIDYDVMEYAEDRKNIDDDELQSILKTVANSLSLKNRKIFEKNIRNWRMATTDHSELLNDLSTTSGSYFAACYPKLDKSGTIKKSSKNEEQSYFHTLFPPGVFDLPVSSEQESDLENDENSDVALSDSGSESGEATDSDAKVDANAEANSVEESNKNRLTHKPILNQFKNNIQNKRKRERTTVEPTEHSSPIPSSVSDTTNELSLLNIASHIKVETESEKGQADMDVDTDASERIETSTPSNLSANPKRSFNTTIPKQPDCIYAQKVSHPPLQPSKTPVTVVPVRKKVCKR